MAIVGAGRVGTSLAVLLERAGHDVVAASGRDASLARVHRHLPATRFVPPREAAASARVVVLGVPDDAIGEVCAGIAPVLRPGQFVLHLSGSMSLAALAPAAAAGAEVLSLHPLQSFPTIEDGLERLPGSGIAVTAATPVGRELGEALSRDVSGVPFDLADEVKPLYHAAAVFCANYLVTVEAVAERLATVAGIAEPLPLLAALARTAFDRTFALGPRAALTGPAVRGDAGTMERNLLAIRDHAPDMVPAYVSLARMAAALAEDAGRLSADDRRRVEETLDRWS